MLPPSLMGLFEAMHCITMSMISLLFILRVLARSNHSDRRSSYFARRLQLTVTAVNEREMDPSWKVSLGTSYLSSMAISSKCMLEGE